MNKLAESLRCFVNENFLFGVDVEYFDDDSFLENGIIDSTGVLELIGHLESTYGIVISDDDLIPENLDSISGLVRFVERKSKIGAATAEELYHGVNP
ncbi:MAG: acyl carrier protein, partial [Pirellulales bacterium]|nr:acyl carrier protein [Pirellulales bacterium]